LDISRIGSLTSRQREILEILMNNEKTNMSYSWMAAQLGLAPETISSHIIQINCKLGVKTRAEAVRLARLAAQTQNTDHQDEINPNT
jgi:DNA-binding CsgD family transcriptional regulator